MKLIDTKKVTGLAVLMSLLCSPVLAEDTTEGRELAKLGFKAADADESGSISKEEMQNYRKDVFISMDSDESDTISREEFMEWDFGFSIIAEDDDKEQGFETAKKFVFDYWDRNKDGEITQDEHVFAIAANMNYADLDEDNSLSEEEFLKGFIVNVAYRAALRPE